MKSNDIKTVIQEHFFINPTTKMRVRQIERELKLPLPSVIRYCKELKEEKILKIEEISKVRFYSADRSSKEFLLEKKLYNIRSTTKLAEFIIKEFDNPAIVLFGSYSKGEDTENSDVDLYIQTPIKDLKLPLKFEKELKRKIQAFTYPNINKLENKNLANNILNGIVLNGFIEVYKT